MLRCVLVPLLSRPGLAGAGQRPDVDQQPPGAGGTGHVGDRGGRAAHRARLAGRRGLQRLRAARSGRGWASEPAHRGARAYDDDALYVGARLYDNAPDSILARLARRDAARARTFSVYLDPYHDRRSGYYFVVNAAGTLYDGTLYNDDWDGQLLGRRVGGESQRDDAGLDGRDAHPVLAAPLRARATARCWGINFERVIQRRNEDGLPGLSAQEGERVRLALPRPGRASRTSRRARDRDHALRHGQGRVHLRTAERPVQRRLASRPERRRRPAHGRRQQAHAERHREPRLRPGRGRPGGGEPVATSRRSIPRSARSSSRARANFSFGQRGRERLLGLQLAGADVLLQPPHRPRAAGRDARRADYVDVAGRHHHPGRRQAHRQALAELELRHRCTRSPARRTRTLSGNPDERASSHGRAAHATTA